MMLSLWNSVFGLLQLEQDPYLPDSSTFDSERSPQCPLGVL